MLLGMGTLARVSNPCARQFVVLGWSTFTTPRRDTMTSKSNWAIEAIKANLRHTYGKDAPESPTLAEKHAAKVAEMRERRLALRAKAEKNA